MTEHLNSPQVLNLIFPALSLMITLGLLRWAISGDKKDTFASLSVGLGCLIAAIIAFGRPGEPFQFSMAAIGYGLIALNLASLLYVAISDHKIVRFFGSLICLALWVWVLIGMPLDLDMMVKASLAGAVLLLISVIFLYRSRWEVRNDGSILGNLIALMVICGPLWVIAKTNDDIQVQSFALGLGALSIAASLWTNKRINFAFQENAVVVLNLCVAALMWDLWLQGQIPLISLVCLILVLFTRSAAIKLVASRPQFVQKAYYGVLFVLALIPAGLSLLFFDILRNL